MNRSKPQPSSPGPLDGLIIRSAGSADGPAIRTLVFGVLEEFGLAAAHEGVDADLFDLEAHYDARGGWFEVVQTADGTVIGSVGLYPHDSTTCELRKMYLAASYRGRGLGRTLLERTIDRARAAGFHTLILETAAVLHAANALYRSAGFQPLTTRQLACRCDQAYVLPLRSGFAVGVIGQPDRSRPPDNPPRGS